jgi:hypothetical protein
MKLVNLFNEVKYKLVRAEAGRFVYHTSNPIFRDQIAKSGLIPKGKSETWLSDTEINGKVIFVTNSDNKEDWFDSTYDDDIYKIDTSKSNNVFYYDPNFLRQKQYKYLITYEPIPLSAIELIHRGTGESY